MPTKNIRFAIFFDILSPAMNENISLAATLWRKRPVVGDLHELDY
jgi:hypothetical protein